MFYYLFLIVRIYLQIFKITFKLTWNLSNSDRTVLHSFLLVCWLLLHFIGQKCCLHIHPQKRCSKNYLQNFSVGTSFNRDTKDLDPTQKILFTLLLLSFQMRQHLQNRLCPSITHSVIIFEIQLKSPIWSHIPHLSHLPCLQHLSHLLNISYPQIS